MRLLDRVRSTVHTHGLFEPGDRVIVALSGGADSVALAYLLRELHEAGEIVLAGVAHFNHQLRGDDAGADERFSVALAGSLGVPAEVDRADVRWEARRMHRSVEDAARLLRYRFLERAADQLKARAIAVAHTVDDQAETFLLRLIRGAGARGLAGIHPRAGRVVRPLLEVRRAELREYLAEHRLSFREDASNADLSIPRNRVRHELIPYLARHFSSGIVEVLAREAAVARVDDDYLTREAIDLARSVVLWTSATEQAGPAARIDIERLRSLHPAMAARVVRVALGRVAPDSFIGAEQVARLLAFSAASRPGGMVSLPGQRARRTDGFVVLEAEPPRGTTAGSNSFRFPLSIPGEVVLASQGWIVSAAEPPDGDAPGVSELAVHVLASAVQRPLVVRSRLPGDRVKPAGMAGRSRKLQDLFVDRKVPRAERDSVPLVVDAAGKIVWVVGEPVAEDFRPGNASAGVILLKARRLGFLGGSG